MEEKVEHDPYWQMIWRQFRHHNIGMIGLIIIGLFTLAAIYAPLLASSKPIALKYDGIWYFPLFRYLFYSGFYTKLLDIFFNLLMCTFPLMVLSIAFGKRYKWFLFSIVLAFQLISFLYFAFTKPKDPAFDPDLLIIQQQLLQGKKNFPNWNFDLEFMNSYAKINLIMKYRIRLQQQESLQPYAKAYEDRYGKKMPTLWQIDGDNEKLDLARQKEILSTTTNEEMRQQAEAKINYLEDKKKWLENENKKISFIMMPLLRPFHWQDDAGGDQSLNQVIPWWDLTRINRKDLLSALIFGIRISLVVGLTSIGLALIIGIPIGAAAGFYGGKLDIIVSRLLEIWESMPTFFMLLLVVAVTQSKSIFLVISVIGIFGWPGFSRYIRGEFFKQRNLSYVEACRSLGFNNGYIMFKHILPNAIPPILTLLPFAIMGAITSEAGLSFLGLGEEGSCSWGVLMDEGRSAFPGESYLLWPPAILLTILLIAIALVGDALRDSLDPKMHK